MGGMVGGIFSAVGNAVNNIYGRWTNERDFAYQKDLNNNAISIRVADAQRAGIHPLYALGPTGTTFSPVSTNFSQDAGQDLSRASMANADRSQREREIAHQALINSMNERRAEEAHGLNMERGALENEILRSQLARNNSAQLGPGGALPQAERQGAGVRTVPSRVVTGSLDNAAREPGAITDFQYYHRNDGSLGIMPSEQMKERSEDDVVSQLGWHARNSLLPFFRGVRPPSTDQYPLPRGYVWRWNPALQGFYPFNADEYHERRRSARPPGRRSSGGLVN